MKRPNPDSVPIKATLLLVSSLTVMAGATIAPSLPEMSEHFANANVDNAAYLSKLALTIPALFIALGGPFAGLLTDRIGRKPLLVGSTLLFACAGSAGFLLNSLWAILFSRILLGISVAGTMTGVLTIIGDYYQGQQRASFMGLQAAAMGMGGVVFICLGGIIANINWRMPFLLYAVAVVFMLLIVVNIFEPKLEKVARGGLGGGHQLKLPRQLLWGIYGTAVFYNMAYFLIPVQLPFYLKDLSNSSPAESGIAIAASTLAGAIASSRYGAVKQRMDYSSVVIVGLLLTAIGLMIVGAGGSYQIVLVGLIVAGFGFGLMMPNFSVWLVTVVPPPLRGRALGGLTTSLFLGQFLSPIFAQPIASFMGLDNTYILTGILLLQASVTFLVVKVSTSFIAEKI
ncbi:MFS transporter [Pleurocapsales cyanobacterium LEGE 10410]|nr:MFS transporter [Pleurocapsales cyanobacterium LEGE 10410]